MLVLALASPKFLAKIGRQKSGDGLLAGLALVRQQELDPPVEAILPQPFSLCFSTLTCPEDNPQDKSKESLQDNPQDKSSFRLSASHESP
jgi:hypothetical protein